MQLKLLAIFSFQPGPYRIEHFRRLAIIGKGNFATVALVADTAGATHAVKVINKAKSLRDRSVDLLRDELDALRRTRSHPFTVTLQACFQSRVRFDCGMTFMKLLAY